ncbi:MAG: SDR family NAD(P)-dependent oxidoreductase [Candidatus Kapabacteria bacterium]|nr:SDR family NAD(P)-dependent oxidoreductase [Candidatus Kapabacteria bacterium]
MTTKTVLITGANKGIGFETALQLGKLGYHIILSARDESKLEIAVDLLKTQGINLTSLQMDVSDLESIKSAFQEISTKFDKIDVIINNAGILLDRDGEFLDISSQTFEKTLQTNAIGPFYIVQTFLPLLQKGNKIINVSSDGGQILNGISTWAPAYCISKTTLNTITLQLASALKIKGISVNAMSPGWVRSDMGGVSASRTLSEGADTIVWLADEVSSNITGKFFKDKKEMHW